VFIVKPLEVLAVIARFKRGVTLVELLVVIAIILIMSTTAIIKFKEWYENYKYLEEVSKAEYALRWAKIKSVELYRFIKVDVSSESDIYDVCKDKDTVYKLKVYNCYFDSACGAPTLMREFTFCYEIEKNGSILFNPRGMLHGINGSICVRKGSSGVKIIVNKVGIRRDGEC